MAKKKKARLTKFGDVAGALNPWLHEEARNKGTKAQRDKGTKKKKTKGY
jgi:hypothetical protein